MQLLLIDDNLDLSANVAEFLESRGHVVNYATDGVKGLELAIRDRYDAVILDLGLPGLDGIAVCKRLRDSAHRDVPLLMLTARDTEAEKLRGFDVGADDYLTKPFSLPELQARLLAIARRTVGALGVLRVEDLTFDLRTLNIRRGSRTLTLAQSGMRVLEQLMRASPGVVSREQIATTIWRDDRPESEAALRVHVFVIRGQIDRKGERKLLHTIHGVGYRLGY